MKTLAAGTLLLSATQLELQVLQVSPSFPAAILNYRTCSKIQYVSTLMSFSQQCKKHYIMFTQLNLNYT